MSRTIQILAILVMALSFGSLLLIRSVRRDRMFFVGASLSTAAASFWLVSFYVAADGIAIDLLAVGFVLFLGAIVFTALAFLRRRPNGERPNESSYTGLRSFMRVILISMVMLVIASGDSVAQDEASMTAHERAAAELIDVLQLEKISMATVDVMAQAMSDQNPMVAEMQDVLVAFTKEFMHWEDMRSEYIRMYREAYTEAELRELIDFYRTPVGRKTIEITPKLMKQAVEFRQKLMQQHLPELQRRIRVRVIPDTLHSR